MAGVMSMPIARPVGPTIFADRNTSSPPPEPKSTTTSPSLRFAVAVGFPHDSPMLASAGIEVSSSAIYPNVSATALTPAWSLERELVATAPYFVFTDSSSSVMLPSHIRLNDFIHYNHICQGVYNTIMAMKQT